jgi:hypothetical protein
MFVRHLILIMPAVMFAIYSQNVDFPSFALGLEGLAAKIIDALDIKMSM